MGARVCGSFSNYGPDIIPNKNIENVDSDSHYYNNNEAFEISPGFKYDKSDLKFFEDIPPDFPKYPFCTKKEAERWGNLTENEFLEANPFTTDLYLDSIDQYLVNRCTHHYGSINEEEEEEEGDEVENIHNEPPPIFIENMEEEMDIDWNNEIQELYDEFSLSVEERTMRIKELSNRFVNFSSKITRLLVYEKDMPQHRRQIGANRRIILGGEKYLVGKCLFNFVETSSKFIGSCENAYKSAINELRAMNSILELDLPSVHFPLTAVHKLFGHVIIARAIAPIIPGETLEYGSEDDGFTIKNGSNACREIISYISNSFCIARHLVVARDDEKKHALFTSTDVEAHISLSDGRLYLLRLYRFFPPIVPSYDNNPFARFYVQFRPEFLTYLSEIKRLPISADVFTGFGEKNAKKTKKIQDEAYTELLSEVIPKISTALVKLYCKDHHLPLPSSFLNKENENKERDSDNPGLPRKLAKSYSIKSIHFEDTVAVEADTGEVTVIQRSAVSGIPVTWDGAVISSILHEKGVNIRFLALIRSLIRSPSVDENSPSEMVDVEDEPLLKLRNFLLQEMVIRCIKARYFRCLRQLPAESLGSHAKLLAACVLLLVVGRDHRSELFWKKSIPAEMIRKFKFGKGWGLLKDFEENELNISLNYIRKQFCRLPHSPPPADELRREHFDPHFLKRLLSALRLKFDFSDEALFEALYPGKAELESSEDFNPAHYENIQVSMLEKLGPHIEFINKVRHSKIPCGRSAISASRDEQHLAYWLKMLEERVGRDHPLILKPLSCLVKLYIQCKSYETDQNSEFIVQKGRVLVGRMLDISEGKRAIADDNSNHILRTLELAAKFYSEYFDHATAVEMEERRFNILRDLDVHERDLLPPLKNLVIFLEKLNRLEHAVRVCLKIIKIYDSIEERGKNFVQSLTDASRFYMKLGNYDEAEPFVKRALETDIELYGNLHENVASDYSSLSRLYNAQKDNKLAMENIDKALNIREKLHGDNHRIVAMDLYMKGLYLAEEGSNFEAKNILNKALVTFQIEDLESKITLTSIALARVHVAEEDYEEAEKLYIKVIKMYEEENIKDGRVPEVTEEIAALYKKMERFQDSLDYFNKCIKLMQHVKGRNHPHVARGYMKKAQLEIENLKKEKDGEDSLLKAKNIYESCFGPSHKKTKEIWEYLYKYYQKCGRGEEEDAQKLKSKLGL